MPIKKRTFFDRIGVPKPPTRFPKGPVLGPNAKKPTSDISQGVSITPSGTSKKPTGEQGGDFVSTRITTKSKPPARGKIPGVKMPSYRPKAYKKGSWPQGLD